MNTPRLRDLLDRVAPRRPVARGRRGRSSRTSSATLPFEDLGFARVDHHRAAAAGVPRGHPRPGQDAGPDRRDCRAHRGRGARHCWSRAPTGVAFEAVQAVVPAADVPLAMPALSRCNRTTSRRATGSCSIAAAGTSDLPVAEEAAVTADVMGNTVDRLYDVGVAGLHRLLARARAPSARACHRRRRRHGRRAARASSPGWSTVPVIAVPTSVGYGASFGGIAALLGMLNSCANGVSVVNIDNGFGAGCIASLINHLPRPTTRE